MIMNDDQWTFKLKVPFERERECVSVWNGEMLLFNGYARVYPKGIFWNFRDLINKLFSFTHFAVPESGLNMNWPLFHCVCDRKSFCALYFLSHTRFARSTFIHCSLTDIFSLPIRIFQCEKLAFIVELTTSTDGSSGRAAKLKWKALKRRMSIVLKSKTV